METSNICETSALTKVHGVTCPKGNLQSHRRENAKTHGVNHDPLHCTNGVFTGLPNCAGQLPAIQFVYIAI